MATRIFELARELDVTSKVVLEKCRAEGIEVKNHMAAVSVGLEATIREWFGESAGDHTAVESTEHVDLASAHADAKKVRKRSRKKTKAEQEDEAVAAALEKKAQAKEAGEVEAAGAGEVVAEAATAEKSAAEGAAASEADGPPRPLPLSPSRWRRTGRATASATP